MKNNFLLVCKYFIICVAILAFIPLPAVNARAASRSRYYAGYYYIGEAGEAPWGVKPNVLTRFPSVPLAHHLFQWGSVVMSYSPLYWVQLGYERMFVWIIFPIVINTFYWEKVDALGSTHTWLLGLSPLGDHTYTYAIWWDSVNLEWIWAVLEGSTWLMSGKQPTFPHNSVDLQVFVETTNWQINIDGSHFTKINYYDPSAPLNWRLWDDHLPNDTYPYYVVERGDYEFYAHSVF